MRLHLFQPFRLQVRLSLWLVWAAIVLGVLTIGNHSTTPNPPAGLLLLGLGLVAPGLLAALALASSTLWSLLIDAEAEAEPTRKHLYAFLAVGAGGLAMAGVALQRLL